MAPPDPRDGEFIDTVVAANVGLLYAAHRGDAQAMIGHVAVLLTAIIERNVALRAEQPERPDDARLRRAVAALNR